MNSAHSTNNYIKQFLWLAVAEAILLAIAIKFELFELWNEGTYASKSMFIPIFLMFVIGFKLIEYGCKIYKDHNKNNK